MRAAAILAAAGSGTRLGAGQPKALVTLAGEALVVHAARALRDAGVIDLIVVCAPAQQVESVRISCEQAGIAVSVVPGGASRSESVACGLQHIPAQVDVVLVHDAARPLASPTLVRRVVAAVAAGSQAVVPAVPIVDTLRRVVASPAGLASAGVVDRAAIQAIQTPQGFSRALLAQVHHLAGAGGTDQGARLDGAGQLGGVFGEDSAHRAGADHGDRVLPITDDAGLVEALGVPVLIVPGEDEALKITTPTDLVCAHALLAARQEQQARASTTAPATTATVIPAATGAAAAATGAAVTASSHANLSERNP